MPSAVAVSESRSESFLFSVGPRAIIAPIPSSIAPARCGFPPGTSVAGETSTTIAISGARPKAAPPARGPAHTLRAEPLLTRGNSNRVNLRVTLADSARRLEGDVGAEPVVERL